jgi:hypothetical protein
MAVARDCPERTRLKQSIRMRISRQIPATPPALHEAIRLIRTTPGYTEVAVDLAQLASENRIRVHPTLEDRAHAGLLGTITLGPEAAQASPLSLAQTLVHEHYHLRRQHPLLKTVSFWTGVLSHTPVMRRYERPAYQAAFDFLEAAKKVHPQLTGEAEAEQAAIRQVFETFFGEPLA